jgi:hypothetical protein
MSVTKRCSASFAFGPAIRLKSPLQLQRESGKASPEALDFSESILRAKSDGERYEATGWEGRVVSSLFVPKIMYSQYYVRR